MDRPELLQVLGKRVRDCRTASGLTLDALGQRTGVPVELIRHFEVGKGGLSTSKLVSLARALGVPAESFLDVASPSPRAYADPAPLFLRKSSSKRLQDSDRAALGCALHRAEGYAELLSLTPTDARVPAALFAPTRPPTKNAHVEGYARAREARRALAGVAAIGISAPLRDLADVIEDRFGILVVELPFTTRDIAEASCRRGGARLIAVDPRRKEEVRRWALAHGLAHQLLDLAEEDVVADRFEESFSLDKTPREQRADAFAAMFLGPEATVDATLEAHPQLKTNSLSDVLELVKHLQSLTGMGFVPAVRNIQNRGRISKALADRLVKEGEGGVEVSGFERPRKEDGLTRLAQQLVDADVISGARARELDGVLEKRWEARLDR